MLCKAKVAVCSEKSLTERNQQVEFLKVKPGGTECSLAGFKMLKA